jgi:hypothetical protein
MQEGPNRLQVREKFPKGDYGKGHAKKTGMCHVSVILFMLASSFAMAEELFL